MKRNVYGLLQSADGECFACLFPSLKGSLFLLHTNGHRPGLQGRKVHQCRISNVAMATLALTMGSERLQQVLIRKGGGGGGAITEHVPKQNHGRASKPVKVSCF